MIYKGTWTHEAEVFCPKCYMTHLVTADPISKPCQDEALCTCQGCGATVSMPVDIARLRSLCCDPRLSDWHPRLSRESWSNVAVHIPIDRWAGNDCPYLSLAPSLDGDLHLEACVCRAGMDGEKFYAHAGNVNTVEDLLVILEGLVFEHGGVSIHDPGMSSCGRFFVDPEKTYGDAYRKSLWSKLEWED